MHDIDDFSLGKILIHLDHDQLEDLRRGALNWRIDQGGENLVLQQRTNLLIGGEEVLYSTDNVRPHVAKTMITECFSEVPTIPVVVDKTWVELEPFITSVHCFINGEFHAINVSRESSQPPFG